MRLTRGQRRWGRRRGWRRRLWRRRRRRQAGHRQQRVLAHVGRQRGAAVHVPAILSVAVEGAGDVQVAAGLLAGAGTACVDVVLGVVESHGTVVAWGGGGGGLLPVPLRVRLQLSHLRGAAREDVVNSSWSVSCRQVEAQQQQPSSSPASSPAPVKNEDSQPCTSQPCSSSSGSSRPPAAPRCHQCT